MVRGLGEKMEFTPVRVSDTRAVHLRMITLRAHRVLAVVVTCWRFENNNDNGGM